MTKQSIIEELIDDLCLLTNDGLPDLRSSQSLSYISEFFTSRGMSEYGNNLIQNLTEADQFSNPALNKVIKYKTVNGEDAEGKVGNLLRRPKEEDAHQKALKALGGEGSDAYKKAMDDLGGENQPQRDIEKEKEKSADAGAEAPAEKEQPKSNAFDANTSGGKDYLMGLPDNDPAKPDEYKDDEDGKGDTMEDDGEVKTFSPTTIKKEQDKLDSMDTVLRNPDEATKERANILKKNWDKFINAKTREEQVEALTEMAEYNLIEGHAGGKKIYLSANTTLPYKHLTGTSGTAVTEEMNRLIKEEGIQVPMRGGAKDRALADMSGKHNEAGVVFYLDGNEQNKKSYEDTQNSFKELGGDEAKFDEINKKAAEVIQNALPEGAQITSAQQVGGIGKLALAQLGIDPKVDPTDLIVQYTLPDGTKGMMKVSAKTYTDPKNITMKNSGVMNAGETYLGEIGKSIDESVRELRSKYVWDDSMDEQQKAELKRNLKQDYLSQFADKMVELTKTEEGQKQLMKMWKDVHGCGQEVYTQIINKTTGDVELKDPDYYCNPQPPFDIKYDGVKLVINMGGKDDSFLQIDMKTEDKSSPKLLFRHRTK